MASRESLFIGIDGSKQTLDAAFGADPHAPLETIPYTDEGVQLLCGALMHRSQEGISPQRHSVHRVQPCSTGSTSVRTAIIQPRMGRYATDRHGFF